MTPTRLSQLIKELEQIRHLSGDIEVWVKFPHPDIPDRTLYGERLASVCAERIAGTNICVIHAQPA